MTDPGPRRPRLRVVLGLALTGGFALAACGAGPSTGAPSSAASATSAAPSIVASASASSAGQTDTTWGRIWDTLPSGFPTIVGAKPVESANGAASATLAVDGVSAKSIATSMQSALVAAGFRMEGLSGPLEDGAYVLDTIGPPAGCKVQVTASPLGSMATVTIMYGAACPHS